MSRRVVIAGGGTGGHVFPGLAVAAELQELGVDVHWLGARRGLEAELVPERGLPVTLVELEGIQARSPAAAARAAALLPRAVAKAVRILLDLEPLAVVGVGGYASAAGLGAAGLLGVPTVLQEQNSIPGMTNLFLAPWSDLICCGFADAVNHFPSLPAEWTGNPVRQRFFQIDEVAPHDPPRLLILGGSQGSLFLNRVLPRALAILIGGGMTIEVRHQTGGRWAEVVKTSYSDFGLEADVSAFLTEPWRALAEADVVVARSGALTVSELAAAGRGALLIPFAAAAANHQEYNARSLEKAGGAVVLTEDDADPSGVAGVLGRILEDPETMQRMGRAASTMALPDAARRIAARVISIGGGL
ncbi:MAG: undecaprenyldiphospho-muramoylpentapeptide beta-N-acetylglucosaminyltransferase [Candidatus Sulfomarinibacteraceae bacterium]